MVKRTSRRRTSRRARRNGPPPLYRAVGVDASGRQHRLGAGPLARMRDTAMAEWMGDPSMRSAYVVDARGNSYLSLEPRDRGRLRANRSEERLDTLEHEVEHELTRAWNSLRAGDTWRANDALAHLDALTDFATPSQRTEIRSLRSAIKQTGAAWHEVARNPAKIGAKLELAVGEGVALVREHRPREQETFIPSSVRNEIRRRGPGIYSYGSGPKRDNVIRQYKAGLAGAMMSARIGAAKVHENHWVIDNHDGYPVVVRIIDDNGKTVFRVEEYARKLVGQEVHVERKRSRSKSASR